MFNVQPRFYFSDEIIIFNLDWHGTATMCRTADDTSRVVGAELTADPQWFIVFVAE